MNTGIPKEIADVIQDDQFDPELRDRIVAWTEESFSLFLHRNVLKIASNLRKPKNAEDQRDIVLELFVAHMFLRSGCKVSYEPRPKKDGGPDFLIELDNERFYCEVARIRDNPKDCSESQEVQISGEKYHRQDILCSPKQFYDIGNIIRKKLLQLETGNPNVIYIRSNRLATQKDDLKKAFDELLEEAHSEKTEFFTKNKFKDEHDFLRRLSDCSVIILDYPWKDSSSDIPAIIYPNPMTKYPLSSTMRNVIDYAVTTPFRFRHNTPFMSVAKEALETPIIQSTVVHTQGHNPDTPQEQKQPERYPLRGKLVRYINPFESVAENDWEALK